MRVSKTLFVLAAALAMSGRAVHADSQKMVDQDRKVSEFTKIHVASGIMAKVESGTAKVTLRGDESQLALVKTEVRGKTLEIGFAPHSGWNTHTNVVATVRISRLEGLEASGGSQIDAQAPSGQSLRLEASGGGHIRYTGKISPAQLEVSASGGAEIDLENAEGKSAKIAGSGGAVLRIAGKAEDAELSFSGGTVIEAAKFSASKVVAEGSGGGTASIDAKAVRGSLSGGTRMHVPSGATVEVSTTGGSEVIRKLK